MTKQTILVIEDDSEIRDVISMYLSKHGFEVAIAERGDQAVSLVQSIRPDLIILDVLLPGKDGFQVCREVRELTSAPILFLSCKREEEDKILGLGLGGDDYMTKPFSPNELVARVKANLRRPYLSGFPEEQPSKLRFGPLQIDLLSRTVAVNGVEVTLSKKEFELLKFLVSRPGQTFSHEELFREIWGQESFNDTRTIIVHISNLRKKIEQDPSNPQYIINVHGVGYKFLFLR